MRLLASLIPASTCTTHSTCSFPHPVSLARLSRARSPPFSDVTAATATASLRRLVVKLRGVDSVIWCLQVELGSTANVARIRPLPPLSPARSLDSGFPCAPKLPRAIGVPLGELHPFLSQSLLHFRAVASCARRAAVAAPWLRCRARGLRCRARPSPPSSPTRSWLRVVVIGVERHPFCHRFRLARAHHASGPATLAVGDIPAIPESNR